MPPVSTKPYVLTACLVFCGAAFPLFAQVNTEGMRVEEALDGFEAGLAGMFQAKGGNTVLYEIGLQSRFEYRSRRHIAFAVFNRHFLETNNDDVTNSGFGHLRYNFKLRTWLSLEAFGQGEFDEARLLKERWLVGSGLRVRLLKSDKIALYYGTSPMIEFEALDPADVTREDPQSTLGRLNNFGVAQLRVDDRLSLGTVAYFQPAFSEPSDFRLLNEWQLEVKFNHAIAFKTAFVLRYDNQPPAELESYDYRLQNGLEFTF